MKKLYIGIILLSVLFLSGCYNEGYVIASYYYKGDIITCSVGFDSNDIEDTMLEKIPNLPDDFICGEDLPVTP